MQSCAIDSGQRLFRCSHCEKIFVSETREKRLQKYLVSESRGAPYCSSITFPTHGLIGLAKAGQLRLRVS